MIDEIGGKHFVYDIQVPPLDCLLEESTDQGFVVFCYSGRFGHTREPFDYAESVGADLQLDLFAIIDLNSWPIPTVASHAASLSRQTSWKFTDQNDR